MKNVQYERLKDTKGKAPGLMGERAMSVGCDLVECELAAKRWLAVSATTLLGLDARAATAPHICGVATRSTCPCHSPVPPTPSPPAPAP